MKTAVSPVVALRPTGGRAVADGPVVTDEKPDMTVRLAAAFGFRFPNENRAGSRPGDSPPTGRLEVALDALDGRVEVANEAERP